MQVNCRRPELEWPELGPYHCDDDLEEEGRVQEENDCQSPRFDPGWPQRFQSEWDDLGADYEILQPGEVDSN